MSNANSLTNIFSISEELTGIHGDSKRCNIDKTGYIYHITQQCWNHRNLFSFDAARYRDNMFKILGRKNGVVSLFNVVMPNHTHDVVYAQNFDDIQKVFILTNSRVAKFICKDRVQKLSKETPAVFQNRPVYTKISSRNQLFYLAYYLYHNPDFLKVENKGIPYSCFEEWQKGNYSGYKTETLEKLFAMPITKILELCKTLDKDSFRRKGNDLYEKYEAEDAILFTRS